MRLLYFIADPLPTHRADVKVIFDKFLYRKGVSVDIVAQSSIGAHKSLTWNSGAAFLCFKKNNSVRDQVAWFFHDIKISIKYLSKKYSHTIVRDKVFSALFILLWSKIRGVPFVYWMSFPMSESFIETARIQRREISFFRYIYLTIKGVLGRYFVYSVVLPNSAHVFVQSDFMRSAINKRHNLDLDKMTAVPMGVDPERDDHPTLFSSEYYREIEGCPTLVYLGTMDRLRKLDFIIDALVVLKLKIPNIKLLMIGDGPSPNDLNYLKAYAKEKNVSNNIIWSGWIDSEEAVNLCRLATVALSIVPRGDIFDSASPTKVLDYLSIGVPTVANDQPDQDFVLKDSGAGLSTPLEIDAFVDAILRIMNDSDIRQRMSKSGPVWVKNNRNYQFISDVVYEKLLFLAQ